MQQSLTELELRYGSLKKEYDALLSQRDFDNCKSNFKIYYSTHKCTINIAQYAKQKLLVEEQAEKIVTLEKQLFDQQIELKHVSLIASKWRFVRSN